MGVEERIDIDKPLWDLSTYGGRWKHFAFITDCRMIFVNEKKLREAKQLCDDYKVGKEPPGTTMADVIRAKQLRDGAFHPVTGELMIQFARLSFQMPTSVMLTSTMLAFQKSTARMVVFQIINQLHNGAINYTFQAARNDNDQTVLSNAFLCAVVASSLVTIACKKVLCGRGSALARTVPFCAVAAGHAANLPTMRYRDITTGIPLFLKDPNYPLMRSKVAGVKGVTECFISRIFMSVPCLLLIPLMSEKFVPVCFALRRPWLMFTVETCLCALCCMFAIPSALALFPQINSMNPQWLKLKPDEYAEFRRCIKEYVDEVYYDKGL